MKVFKMEAIPDYYPYLSFVEIEKISYNEIYDKLSKKIDINDWKPWKLKLYRNRKKSDYPHFLSGFPVFSEKALTCIRDLLSDKLDILPLDCDKGKYSIVNIYSKIDCINYDNSQCTKFESGHVREFHKFAFKHSKLIGEHIFKIPEIVGMSMVFVSDEFRERVVSNGLVGFNFMEVWNSDGDISKESQKTEKTEFKEFQAGIKLPSLENQIPHEEMKEVLHEMSEPEARAILSNLKSNLFDIVVHYVKAVSSEKGSVDSLGLEYYFDGQFTDIGLRIVFISDSAVNKFEDLYFNLLKHPRTSDDFILLNKYYIKNDMNSSETTKLFRNIEEIVTEVNNKINDTKWDRIATITNEFNIEEPELYD
jgi:hypothetical protein